MYCLDMPRFGGPGCKKKCCIHRKCKQLVNTTVPEVIIKHIGIQKYHNVNHPQARENVLPTSAQSMSSSDSKVCLKLLVMWYKLTFHIPFYHRYK